MYLFPTLFYPCVDCVDRKYGKGTFTKYEHEIKQKCNQKCIDVCHKRIKKEKAEVENAAGKKTAENEVESAAEDDVKAAENKDAENKDGEKEPTIE